MQVKWVVPLIALLGLMLNSCSSDNPVQDEGEFTYPMKVGNRWQYHREIAMFNFRPDSGHVSFDDTTFLSSSVVEVIRTDLLRDSINTFVFRENLTENGRTFAGETHLNNKADGMYYYAYTGAATVTPLKASLRPRLLFKGKGFISAGELLRLIEKGRPAVSIQSDSLRFEEPPLRSLIYPLQIGTQWNYRAAGSPWRYDKKVVGKESLKVPAGSFSCMKVQWLIDVSDDGMFDDDIEFFDFIANSGLVRRSILIKDVALTNESSPERIGLIDIKEDAQLVAVNLN